MMTINKETSVLEKYNITKEYNKITGGYQVRYEIKEDNIRFIT
ncbi:MAG: hypothetical protein ACRDCB_06775 [Clostridium sp.]